MSAVEELMVIYTLDVTNYYQEAIEVEQVGDVGKLITQAFQVETVSQIVKFFVGIAIAEPYNCT